MCDIQDVPSLYVRVYHLERWIRIFLRCSLTIREGVSFASCYCVCPLVFPHYTWGCIAKHKAQKEVKEVPSLYVRVYRTEKLWEWRFTSSLTIREGISKWIQRIWLDITFPHYTWGYIDKTAKPRRFSHVPSLYVRVYRLYFGFLGLFESSLTIREGISPRTLEECRPYVFPHYTWGYIAACIDVHFFRTVPSLYVRVYRQHIWHTF